jgi:hypothetical protein
MKHQRHFERTVTSREAMQISELIADLDRIVSQLNGDIAAEEERAGIFDRSCAKYPQIARMFAERRDNLAETIAALERRRVGFQTAHGDEVSA